MVFIKMTKRLIGWMSGHIHAFIANTKAAAKITVKGLLMFFGIFILGNMVGGFINSWLNIQPGADFVGYLIASFVPVLVIYLVWIKFGQKKEA